jgi:hypothetical protein
MGHFTPLSRTSGFRRAELGLAGVAGCDGWRPVEVEAGYAGVLDPSAVVDQTIGNQHGQSEAQVICSTGLLLSSHVVAAIYFCLPWSSTTG